MQTPVGATKKQRIRWVRKLHKVRDNFLRGEELRMRRGMRPGTIIPAATFMVRVRIMGQG